ncbi:MAG: OsmC family peroxiredoxin [Gammaproteobacteria bacterium]|nr:OsmC family peroxiredoxin [Gammaproteobacteria bacterium]
MSDSNQIIIELEHVKGLEFSVKFDLGSTDEPPEKRLSIGGGAGPSATRLLTAAAANCLAASLLYCVAKNAPPAGSLRTSAVCTLSRNEKGRQRIGNIAVTLEVSSELEQAARMNRCLNVYEDFSLAAASLREGFPIDVRVVNDQGVTLQQSGG